MSFAVIGVSLVVFGPLGLIIYQSFLSALFSPTAALSLGAYRYVLTDSGFHSAFGTSLLVSLGMTLISVPLGSLLAFLLVRTDLPGKEISRARLLVPIFLSPVVLAFGYVVAVGPVGFFCSGTKALVGRVPWNLLSLLRHDFDRWPHPRASFFSLCLRRAAQFRPIGRGNASCRRRPMAHCGDGQPAADQPALLFSARPGVLPRLRAVRPAAGPGRSGAISCCRRTCTS